METDRPTSKESQEYEQLSEEEEDEPDEEAQLLECKFMFRIHSSTESFTLEAQESWSAATLKKHIQQIKSIPWEEQKLVHEDTVLSDDDQVVNLRKKPGDAVELLLVMSTQSPPSTEVINWIRHAKRDWQKLCLEEFRDGTSLVKVPAWIFSDRRVMVAAIASYPFILELADAKVKADPEVVLFGVRKHRGVMKFCARQLLADPKFFLSVVKIDAFALEYASAQLKRDATIVLEAIKIKFQAFKYAGDALKKDREFILAALQSKVDAGMVAYAHDSLLRDRKFVLEAVSLDWRVLSLGKAALQPLLSDREILLAAVKQDGKALQHAAEELRADAGVVVSAAASERTAVKHASPTLFKDSEFMLALAERAPAAFEYLPEDLVFSRVLTQEHFNRLPALVPCTSRPEWEWDGPPFRN